MKVGDLVELETEFADPRAPRFDVRQGRRRIGIITRLWVGGSASVLFEDGEYDVDEDDLEVVNEAQ